jgi:hypothetical protein
LRKHGTERRANTLFKSKSMFYWQLIMKACSPSNITVHRLKKRHQYGIFLACFICSQEKSLGLPMRS